MSLFQTYPPSRLNYYTLTKPSTFTDYCFSPNCPGDDFSYALYSNVYTHHQEQEQKLGLQRYLGSRQIERDENIHGNPVFNSNMKPLSDNNMKYVHNPGYAPVSPWSAELTDYVWSRQA